jgi:hypothetical protein
MGLISVKSEAILVDFYAPERSGQWYIVNDKVMGGMSNSDALKY